jgi:hypothetical protein
VWTAVEVLTGVIQKAHGENADLEKSKRQAEIAVGALVAAGLMPSEEEWAVWRTWDNRYFPQASKEAALAVQVTDNFVPVSRYTSPWKVRGDVVD